ncbi:Ribonuclease 3 [Caballeronia sp. SBC1]|uniref:ribonuclease III n=1 Tax=unclassified Caballeronia TaxID=2646786 RepID=UPI0013E1B678|nr:MULTISPECIES: ribonuclease III [unclassified Caballeronia]QIE24536.1 Ribonuclease 3 [Caballeronia sp. SBC2]QIN62428.1 Ribonuclease 3 [Caballeronia sp. SBC1]
MPSTPLESRLQYEFRNAELLRQAMTHRSHSATHNERLEFLGDSVLNCVVAALLFQRFAKLDEGDLSRVRANLVKQQSLYEIAQALNVSEALRLGEGELRSGGFRRPSILADTLEAIFGAVFLDGGFDAALQVIKRLYTPILDHIDPRTIGKDAKTLLQEYLQGHKIALPTYTVVATHGAAHNQQFEVECTVPKLEVKVSGSGASRRAAEQAAAKKALDELASAAPAMTAKPKRKGARAAKQVEPEIVPGVTGVQAALDLRAPDRRERARASSASSNSTTGHGSNTHNDPERPATAPFAVIRASHVEPSAGAFASAEKTERTTIHRAEKTEKAEKAATEMPVARSENTDKPSAVHVEPAVDNAVHNPVEKSAAKADSAGEKAVAKQADKQADKPAAKSAEASAAEKPASPARQREDVPAAHSATASKGAESVDAKVEAHLEESVDETVVRAADTGH